jgi:hypothetical protein
MKNGISSVLVLGVALILGSNWGFAATQDGAEFAEQVQVPEKRVNKKNKDAAGQTIVNNLVLNGTGTRTATLFKLKVYAAGLYLQKRSQDALAIINSTGPKKLEMKFFRNVSEKDIRKNWDESVKKNCSVKCDEIKEKVSVMNSWMGDMRVGDMIEYVFSGDQVEVFVHNKSKGILRGRDLQKFMLSTWLGEHPPTEQLKLGLLGASKETSL